MKKCIELRGFAVLSFLMFLVGAAFGQSLDSSIAEAKAKYSQGAFADAMVILDQAQSLNSDMYSKSTLSDVYTEFALKEYLAQNFKNSYDAYRQALKLNPINQVAIQGYLKLKQDHGTENLQNLGRALPEVPTEPDRLNPSGASASPQTPSNSATTPVDLQKVMDQLKKAESKLNNAQSSVSTSKSENDFLKQQIDQQKAMIEKLLTTQASSPRQSTNPQEAESVQRSLQLLSQIAAQNAKPAAPQVVLQTDPTLQALLKRVEEQSKTSGWTVADTVGLVSAIVLGLLLLGLLLAFFLVVRRSRNPVRANASVSGETGNYVGRLTASPLTERSRPALLEFVGQSSHTGKDLELRKALLKADHLQTMYDDVRNGTITWETVRSYIDELDTALKADILKVVENKLTSGDLLSNDAVLPVLFPFLTDYDEFLRDKAAKLVKTALIEDQRNPDVDSDPLSIKTLLAAVSKLETVLRGRDRTLITAKLCRAVAKELGLSIKDCQTVYKGALVHDLGYLMIDADRLQRIIAKPEISEEDFELIKSHTNLGLNYFPEVDLDLEIRNAILYHHERNDGSGYPNGMKNEEIPQIAKIIGVCETFATLLQPRAYREKVSVEHSLAIIKDGARLKFDRTIVEALVKVVAMGGAF